MWLERFAGRVLDPNADPAPDSVEARVAAAGVAREPGESAGTLADALLAALSGGGLSDAALARTALALREHRARVDTGGGLDAADAGEDRLWGALADGCADPRTASRIAMCAADGLLRRGDEAGAIAWLAAALDRDPALWPEVSADLGPRALARARRAGPGAALSFELAELAARLPDLPGHGDEAGPAGGDDIRERYSELLEAHRGDGAATARIRELGRRIAALEEAGVLPRVLMRRGSWRRDEE